MFATRSVAWWSARARSSAMTSGLCSRDCPWEMLHVVRPESGDVLEAEPGTRLALAASGPGVRAGDVAGGHWPLVATSRGIVEVRRERCSR